MDRPLIGISSSYLPDRRYWGARPPAKPDRPTTSAAFDIVDRHYIQAVVDCGGAPFILPVLDIADVSIADQLMSALDALLLSGGGGVVPKSVREQPELPSLREQSPRRYDSDAAYLRTALERGLPVLGICRGMQTINEVLGGAVARRRWEGHHQGDRPGWEPSHTVRLHPKSRLASLVGTTNLDVNSFHSQAVTKPAPGMMAAAWAPDGLIEAIENESSAFLSPIILGLQFHPERMLGHSQREAVIGAFIKAAIRTD